jgi:hypothetical protein
LKSDSTGADISQHDDDKYGSLSLSLASGKGGPDSNPFASGSAKSAGSAVGTSAGSTATATGASAAAAATTQACTPSASSASSKSTGFFPPWMGGSRPTGTYGPPGPFQTNYYKRDTNDCDSGTEGFNNHGANIQQMNNIKRMAHGILASLAFAVFFPLGAISIRVFSFSGVLWFHAGVQIIANIMFIIAFVIGVGMAKNFGEVCNSLLLYASIDAD